MGIDRGKAIEYLKENNLNLKMSSIEFKFRIDGGKAIADAIKKNFNITNIEYTCLF